MRKITKNTFGLFSLGVLGISYATGAAAELPQSFNADAPIAIDGAAGSPSAAATDSAPINAAPSATSSASSSATASSSQSATSTGGNISPSATKKPSKSSSGSSSGTGSTSGTGTGTAASTPPAPPAPSASPSATATQPATTTVTKTGASIKYKYGTVQLSVTKVNGKITNVTVVQGTATDGRARTFPTLVSAAVSAQGVSFGNISNATFTTDAFKEALTSALGMF